MGGVQCLRKTAKRDDVERKNTCIEISSVGGSRIYERTSKAKLRKNERKSITEKVISSCLL